eukprot:751433-Hanusia_phi.AAC.2
MAVRDLIRLAVSMEFSSDQVSPPRLFGVDVVRRQGVSSQTSLCTTLQLLSCQIPISSTSWISTTSPAFMA